MRVRGRLVDTKPLGLGRADGSPLTIHDMVVDLFIAMPDFVIDRVEVTMQVHPYEACTGVVEDYQQLVGLSITRGYSRRVRELFGGPNGCSTSARCSRPSARSPSRPVGAWSPSTRTRPIGPHPWTTATRSSGNGGPA